MTCGWIKLFEESQIPAQALYQARNAASNPKKPPALLTGTFRSPSTSWKRAIARRRKAISSVKKSRKKASVDFSVQKTRIVVKMNQP